MIDYTLMLETLITMSKLFSTPVMIACIICGIVEAFFGYKIYKVFLRASFALGAGLTTYEIIAFYLPIDTKLPELFGLRWTAVIVLFVSILAAVLAPYIYKFITGAIVGASIGAYAIALCGVKNAIVISIVAAIVAILFGLLFRKIFKAVYILSSSFGGMLTSAYACGVILFPETFRYYLKESFIQTYTERGATAADIQMALAEVGLANVTAPTSDVGLLVFAALLGLGLIAAIVATIIQFKANKDN